MVDKSITQFKHFASRLSDLLELSVDKKRMAALAEEARVIIVRRTRLGKGVFGESDGTLGQIKYKAVKFEPLSTGYVRWRRKNKPTGPSTPAKSNLTFTGEMIDSLRVTDVKKRQATIEPTGKRNILLAGVHSVGDPERNLPQRPFLGLSALDDKKLVRFYRRTFGDLVRRSGVNKK